MRPERRFWLRISVPIDSGRVSHHNRLPAAAGFVFARGPVMSESSVELLQRWKDGDERAAAVLFDRYVNQLCAMARNRLSDRMQRRVEAEDIVQSAYRSFFRHVDEDRYTLSQSGDLWKLLAAITINKLRGQVEFHTAQKRGVYTEESLAGSPAAMGVKPHAMAEQPTPEDATAVVEELENVMRELTPLQRRILELALQNKSESDIAAEIERSGRTVRRTLQLIQEQLESRLLGNAER